MVVYSYILRGCIVIKQNDIVNQCFCWLRDRFSDRTNANLIEYILPNLEDKVEELEIWLPVSGFLLEDTIQIGKVHFRPITKELLDGGWYLCCQKTQMKIVNL